MDVDVDLVVLLAEIRVTSCDARIPAQGSEAVANNQAREAGLRSPLDSVGLVLPRASCPTGLVDDVRVRVSRVNALVASGGRGGGSDLRPAQLFPDEVVIVPTPCR
jgi:hypothetical protein